MKSGQIDVMAHFDLYRGEKAASQRRTISAKIYGPLAMHKMLATFQADQETHYYAKTHSITHIASGITVASLHGRFAPITEKPRDFAAYMKRLVDENADYWATLDTMARAAGFGISFVPPDGDTIMKASRAILTDMGY